jgi:trehalose-6-phosphatase
MISLFGSARVRDRSRLPRRLAARFCLAGAPLLTPMELLEFDGGIEMRMPGRDKGDAVRTILDEIGPEAPVAYLGDDATDERAFLALGTRGLSVLVRPESRNCCRPVDQAARRFTRVSDTLATSLS